MTDGSTTWNYTYNADGLRTKRTNGTTTYNYVYNGDKLSQMTVGSNSLYFAYDASGVPMSVDYNGTTYYYVTNVQGDVIGILNASGALVVSYTYDAWGNQLSCTGSLASTLGAHNPLRYRGYVYDQETQLYYLQSRYYNPETGRFINGDAFASTGQGILGNNMFAYCNNNPVNFKDPTGYCTIIGTLLSAIDCGNRYCILSSNYNACLAGIPSGSQVLFSKQRTLRPDTGLQDLPDDEIQRRARDGNLSGEERNRYKREEKQRGLRNKQKRKSKFSTQTDWDFMAGAGIVTVGVVVIAVIVADDASVVGILDDGAILPVLEVVRQGIDKMMR